MISYTYRYVPIWQELQKLSEDLRDDNRGRTKQMANVLEVGSGAEGLALFWKGDLLAIDVRFKRRPMAAGVLGSTLHLPFGAGSFPVVISCDMLEHLPAAERHAAVSELLRVSDGRLLLGFPSGPAAWQLYLELAQALGKAQPVWLQEHLALGLPDADEVAGWLRAAGWEVDVLWYESAAAHKRLLWWERGGLARWFSYLLTHSLGRFLMACIANARCTPQKNEDAIKDLMRVLLYAQRVV